MFRGACFPLNWFSRTQVLPVVGRVAEYPGLTTQRSCSVCTPLNASSGNLSLTGITCQALELATLERSQAPLSSVALGRVESCPRDRAVGEETRLPAPACLLPELRRCRVSPGCGHGDPGR